MAQRVSTCEICKNTYTRTYWSKGSRTRTLVQGNRGKDKGMGKTLEDQGTGSREHKQGQKDKDTGPRAGAHLTIE